MADVDTPIATPRLELVRLGRAFLASAATGQPRPDLGFSDPADFLAGAEDVVQLRLAQIDADPAVEPWLLRAIDRAAVGFIQFHAAPDRRGMVELGYEVLPAFRRREAAVALIAWATRRGARVIRASVSPDNVASLAMLARDGFTLVGEQLDEADGRELVFEKVLAS